MSVKLLHEYHLGDMLARYTMDTDSGQAGFLLLPAGMPLGDSSDKNARTELPVQLKLTGDTYDEAYAMGNTMRNSETVRCLEYGSQKEETKGDVHQIDTVYQDTRGNRVIHHLRWKEQASYVKISCTYENRGKEECTLEMFESFSLGGLSPYLAGDGHECMYLH